jgi:hypothetical protein
MEGEWSVYAPSDGRLGWPQRCCGTGGKEKNFSNTAVFWVVTPCSSQTARRSGVTYRLHLQGQRVSHARNQKQAASYVRPDLTCAACLACLPLVLVSSEMLGCLRNTRRWKPEDRTLHNHRRDKLKFNNRNV